MNLFAQGVAAEERGKFDEAAAAYLELLQSEPKNCSAHVNLGTIYYNQGNYAKAEKHYRAAVKADPAYSLALFDLANVLDETDRVAEAIKVYKTALGLAPTYADAHYNLALAYEKIGEYRKAVPHWRTYTKLDVSGPWHKHAAYQLVRAKKREPIQLVRSNDNPRRTKRRAKLRLVK